MVVLNHNGSVRTWDLRDHVAAFRCLYCWMYWDALTRQGSNRLGCITAAKIGQRSDVFLVGYVHRKRSQVWHPRVLASSDRWKWGFRWERRELMRSFDFDVVWDKKSGYNRLRFSASEDDTYPYSIISPSNQNFDGLFSLQNYFVDLVDLVQVRPSLSCNHPRLLICNSVS